MFVTPLDERDVSEFKPNGCKSGDMSPGCPHFPNWERLMGIKICLLAVFLGSGLPHTYIMARASNRLAKELVYLCNFQILWDFCDVI